MAAPPPSITPLASPPPLITLLPSPTVARNLPLCHRFGSTDFNWASNSPGKFDFR
ncbi:hypothetical protein A2U01_0043189, partial [Trifolium medium]|nr:hypothetical protein [Trifolium medium]